MRQNILLVRLPDLFDWADLTRKGGTVPYHGFADDISWGLFTLLSRNCEFSGGFMKKGGFMSFPALPPRRHEICNANTHIPCACPEWIRVNLVWIRSEFQWIRGEFQWIRGEFGVNFSEFGWVNSLKLSRIHSTCSRIHSTRIHSAGVTQHVGFTSDCWVWELDYTQKWRKLWRH